MVRIYQSPTGEVHALKGVDAVIPAGQMTAITGPSGSGKSSLLRILAAQDRPTAGRATIAGEPLAGLSARRMREIRRRHVGYIFPRPAQNLTVHLTAYDHLMQAGRLRGQSRSVARKDAARLLTELGLSHRIAHLPRQLSGGEQQRLAIGQAIIGGPSLLIADEPTGELDSATTADLLRTFRGLADQGSAVVLATHDSEVAAAADRILHLRSGAVAHEEIAGERLAVIDGEGRVQIPEALLSRFIDRRVRIEISQDGLILKVP